MLPILRVVFRVMTSGFMLCSFSFFQMHHVRAAADAVVNDSQPMNLSQVAADEQVRTDCSPVVQRTLELKSSETPDSQKYAQDLFNEIHRLGPICENEFIQLWGAEFSQLRWTFDDVCIQPAEKAGPNGLKEWGQAISSVLKSWVAGERKTDHKPSQIEKTRLDYQFNLLSEWGQFSIQNDSAECKKDADLFLNRFFSPAAKKTPQSAQQASAFDSVVAHRCALNVVSAIRKKQYSIAVQSGLTQSYSRCKQSPDGIASAQDRVQFNQSLKKYIQQTPVVESAR